MNEKSNENYTELIRNVGKKLIDDFKVKGHVMTGENGPYNDIETEVRDLSHLIIITVLEIELFGRTDYEEILEQMGDYLLSMKNDNGLYILRQNEKKDASNGVIGHSWVIEALNYLYRHMKRKVYLDNIRQIIEAHPYDYDIHLWSIPDYERQGYGGDFDYTLNHQLWYAASLIEANAQICNEEDGTKIDDFLNHISKNMWIHSNGMICHPIYIRKGMYASLKQGVRFFIDIMRRSTGLSSYKYREEGYHVFNIMALARIKNMIPDHKLFGNYKIRKAVDCLTRNDYIYSLKSDSYKKDNTIDYTGISEQNRNINIYGYPYNVIGFEMKYIQKIFNDIVSEKIANIYIKEQFLETFDYGEGLFGNNCNDKVIVNYRVYEYYRYLELV